jgi:SAM-dependent methyltransferase
MDRVTNKNRAWLDQRFKRCDEYGIYVAHQPIYGFRKDHSEPGLISRYIRTYETMKALSHLKFNSLLDVGGAEGYKARIAEQLLSVMVKNSDLSGEACRRAKEIFNVESICADIHNLPFKDDAFDVILCSETLEHVADLRKAVDELLRVARYAMVITVPHESRKATAEEVSHAHIHYFDLASFDFLESQGYRILSRRMVSPLLFIPTALTEAVPQKDPRKLKYPRLLVLAYNALVPLLRKLLSSKAAAFLLYIDDIICKFTTPHNAILFTIIKDDRYYKSRETRHISPAHIIDFTVPYHYLEGKKKRIRRNEG